MGTGPEINALVARAILGRDQDVADPVGQQGPHDLRHGDPTDRILAAGHGDRAVVEQLVGDVDTGRDRSLDGQLTGVEERAVAEVLQEVRPFDERRHADPLGTLAAHRGDAADVAEPIVVHQEHHRVAADARADE